MQRYILIVTLVLACCYRVMLWDIFAGWEESDYGNIAMVQGVKQSGFTHYDMNHMPGYYGLAALLLFFTEDTALASKLASTIGGMGSLLVLVWLMKRCTQFWPALFLSCTLFFQPEFSLYSSSALREPVYTLFLVLMVLAMYKERWWLLGCASAGAFLVRFELPLVLAPLLIIFTFRYGWKAYMGIMIPLVSTIALWMFYCWNVYETFAFWSHAATSNIETGLGAEAQSKWDWFQRGSLIVSTLLFELLPSRVGWCIFAGWGLSWFWIPRKSKVWNILIFSYSLVGVWLSIAFVAQHNPDHNLYWKWMFPLVPFISFCGIWTLWCMSISLKKSHRIFLWGAIISSVLVQHIQESIRQVERSWTLYRPQIVLAEDIEDQAPLDRLLLVDNIPACWMNRKPHDRKLISWFDVPVAPNDPEAFAQWLQKEKVWGVLWFREDWTQAPKIAPFLAAGTIWKKGDVVLRPEGEEKEYGWIFYRSNL